MVPPLPFPRRLLYTQYFACSIAVLSFWFLASGGCRADPLLQRVEPLVNRLPSNEIITTGEGSQPDIVDPETRNVIYFTFYQCMVGPHEYCGANENMDVPAGRWQICKVVYNKVEDTGNQDQRTLAFGPARYATHDPDEPVSYRRAMMSMFVTGDKQDTGGTLRLENLGLQLISSNASSKARIAEGCDIPQPPGLIGD